MSSSLSQGIARQARCSEPASLGSYCKPPWHLHSACFKCGLHKCGLHNTRVFASQCLHCRPQATSWSWRLGCGTWSWAAGTRTTSGCGTLGAAPAWPASTASRCCPTRWRCRRRRSTTAPCCSRTGCARSCRSSLRCRLGKQACLREAGLLTCHGLPGGISPRFYASEDLLVPTIHAALT